LGSILHSQKQFIYHTALNREKKMAEDIKEPWLNYLALTTVIFAVCATLATFKGGGFSTRSVLSQTQASDQWAFYQAKAIKSYLYQMQAEKLEMDMLALTNKNQGSVLIAYKEKIADYEMKVKKYEKEKEDIKQEAKKLEQIRDSAQVNSKKFGMAVIFLQITILLSSIAGLLKKKPVWYFSLMFGALGLVYFADGFLLFM
jgi:hypothetical protein